ncbi:acid protease [Amniculicola lignicola CBS 123094]|uniref:Acid protease n=1 Tax=Amniculicola lignicola CBS 123094 TaxID=1392246 RepID=A0A6A5WB56_9PLEO|nr:acid protease [Amniculicola lignicola CBS 123094]
MPSSAMAFTLSLVMAFLFTLASGATGQGGYVELPVRELSLGSRHPLSRRQNEIPLPNMMDGLQYVVTLSIGSNKQPVPVLFDTGSDLLWVNPDCSHALNGTQKLCYSNPRYNALSSNSSKILDEALNITYGSGATLGVFFEDDVELGNAVVKSQQFGVATYSETASVGILGGQPGIYANRTHKTFVESLVEQKQVRSGAYSVDLRSRDETGAVIFGGIDTKKYKCKLEKVESAGFNIVLTGMGQTFPNASAKAYSFSMESGIGVFVDSGTNFNMLPADVVFGIAADYPGATSTSDGSWRVPCEAPDGKIDFVFGNKTIGISYSDMVVADDGECFLGFVPRPDDLPLYVPYIFGSSFLRGVYAVFDWENDQIWLDESDDCGSNLLPIEKGKDGVPKVAGCKCNAKASSTIVYPAPTTIRSVN